MKSIRYYLTVFEIDTDTVVYENGFYTIDGVIEEQEEWDTDIYDFEVEAVEAEAAE
jgi:hypothetical protein